jgi:hypothetical protein
MKDSSKVLIPLSTVKMIHTKQIDLDPPIITPTTVILVVVVVGVIVILLSPPGPMLGSLKL